MNYKEKERYITPSFQLLHDILNRPNSNTLASVLSEYSICYRYVLYNTCMLFDESGIALRFHF